MQSVTTRRVPRWAAIAMLGACFSVAGTGVAMAVSGGGYSPGQQNCTSTADQNTNNGSTVEPGCHSATVAVEDGKGNRYAEAGIDQMPNGPSTPGLAGVGYPGKPNFPHAGCVAVNTDGTGGGQGTGCGTNKSGFGFTLVGDTEKTKRNSFTPETGNHNSLSNLATNGVNFYMGADDNLDAGEHDSVDLQNGTANSSNGPSDGGAVQAHVTPGAAKTKPSAANPVPVAGAGEGFCADGVCQDVTTYQQALYQGNPNGNSSRDVANYDGKQWDPYNCSSGSPQEEKNCQNAGGPGSMDGYRAEEAHTVYAEPGVQVYEDPDPQGSPIDPLYEAGVTKTPALYPLVGAYAGTCGVIVGGGALPAPAGTPSTNRQHQVVVDPTKC
jgi:hypothetical protein